MSKAGEILENLNKFNEEDNILFSFTDEVHDAYNKARAYVKEKLQQLVKEIDIADAVDLYDMIYELLNDIHNNIRDNVATISRNYRQAKADFEAHPEEKDKIEEWYGRSIRREIDELNQKLGA